MMQKVLHEDVEGCLQDFSESDRYSADSLDLLNLPIRRRGRDKKSNCNFDGSGDQHYRHPPQRNQRNQRRKNQSGDVPELNLLPTTSRDRRLARRYGRSVTDDKSVHLLYSNKQNFNRAPPEPSEDSIATNSRQTQTNSRKVTIFTSSMANNPSSSRKKSPTSGEGGAFPFKVTPSGNFKVKSDQVVFESHKLSVLVADPHHTKVKINPNQLGGSHQAKMANDHHAFPKHSAMDTIISQGGLGSFGSLLASSAPIRREKESSEYEGRDTNEILDPELNLNRLGYSSNETIEWDAVNLPEKKNLYLELFQRITNYTNADCKVYIGNEEFNCHLIVLQCYSEVFDAYVAVKKVELPSDKVGSSAFVYIYEWMITGEPSYKELTRENVLDIFNAAKYLKIKDLMEQCWAFIDTTDIFSEDTGFLLYMDAKDKQLSEVRELMLPRIQKFFLMLVSSQDWLDLDLEDMTAILRSNYICVSCEMEIFMAGVRWLRHDWEDRCQFIVPVMQCVRFGNIAPWQLVDIKRNPDNPEFTALADVPEICKMIDDGLAFVIIKYWYGQENDDFLHWNNILGLTEPPTRNWSGMDKTYFTYREFLIYLDQYRRNQMIEKTHPREIYPKRKGIGAKTSPTATIERMAPRIPTMDEFLTSRKTVPIYFEEDQFSRKRSKQEKERAATTIQAAFRGYLTRQMLKQYSPRYKRLSSSQHYKQMSPMYRQNVQVMQLFTPSQNRLARTNMNQMSASALGPLQKEYITETSLFLSDRESVLVFGGIDPHTNYGVGRNTGKDIFRYVPDTNIWEYVGELPEPRHHHSVAFFRGRVYLAGGADPRDDDVRGKSVVVDTVWSFEAVKRCWFSEGSLNTPRKNFGLVVSKHSMYAIGGQDRQGRTLGSVEKFNADTGFWEFQASLLNPRMGVACTKYRDHIWVAGGMSGSRRNPLSSSVECYNIEKNQWSEITQLRFPRCFSCMFAMSDKLYLIGGAGKVTDKDKTTTSVPAIDVWDTASMQWKHHTDMAIPRHGHAIAYLGTQILIIGGVTTVYMRALSNTECYCSDRGTWVRGIACLPTTLSGHASVTLPPGSLM